MKRPAEITRFFGHSRFIPVRLSAYYAAHFACTGIQLPFWAAWLASRGLSPGEIGILLALGPWVSIGLSPLAGRIADGSGRGRTVMGVLAVLVTLGFLGFTQATSLTWMGVLSVLAFGSHSALLPLAESVTQERVLAGDAFYGRVRLWGSISFIVLSAASGSLVASWGIGVVPWVLASVASVCALCSQLLPARESSALPRRSEMPTAGGAIESAPLRSIRWTPLLYGMALANGIQATHAIYYGFGSLVWRSRDLSDRVIGLLWAEGVVAEVLLFALSPMVLRRLSPASLLACGALGAACRWAVLAQAHEIGWIALAQLLHAVTFGATHLGGMELLRRAVPSTRLASVQGIYSAIAGCATGLGTWIAGQAFARWGADSYWGASALAGIFGCVALLGATRYGVRQASTRVEARR